MFGLLSVFVCVNEYCNYFILLFALNVQYVGDNLGVINKLLNIKKNHYDKLYQRTDHDAVLWLKEYMPKKIETTHVKSHFDSRKMIEDLTLLKRWNICAGRILFFSTIFPLAINIKDTPFAIHINNIYFSNKYVTTIRSSSGELEARTFLKQYINGQNKQLMQSNSKRSLNTSRTKFTTPIKNWLNFHIDGYHLARRTMVDQPFILTIINVMIPQSSTSLLNMFPFQNDQREET